MASYNVALLWLEEYGVVRTCDDKKLRPTGKVYLFELERTQHKHKRGWILRDVVTGKCVSAKNSLWGPDPKVDMRDGKGWETFVLRDGKLYNPQLRKWLGMGPNGVITQFDEVPEHPLRIRFLSMTNDDRGVVEDLEAMREEVLVRDAELNNLNAQLASLYREVALAVM